MSAHDIVVGVDGSPASLAALQWAVDEALLRDLPVRAVGVVAVRLEPSAPLAGPLHDNGVNTMARILENAIDEVKRDGEAVTIQRDVITGHPSQELVALGENAELLVVGRRGHSALAGLLMGSVAVQVSAHAACPVVVVREAQ